MPDVDDQLDDHVAGYRGWLEDRRRPVDFDAIIRGDAPPIVLPALEPAGARGRSRLGAVAAAVLLLLFALAAVGAVRWRHADDTPNQVVQPPLPPAPGTSAADVAPGPSPTAVDEQAGQVIAAALGHTTDASTFHIAYSLHFTPPPAPPVTKCGPIPRPPSAPTVTSCSQVTDQGASTTGEGTITISPKSMVVSAHVNSGFDVTLQLIGDQVWETGGAGYGGPPSGPGQPLSGFADLVEGTIGPRAGALGMTRLASPNAYLALQQGSITGVTPAGTGSVDGVPVTNYDVTVDITKLADTPGLTADETKTIRDALGVLRAQGYTNTAVTVSVAGDGLIHQLHTVANFDDGSTVTFDATYSAFGCPAGSPAGPSCLTPTTTATTATATTTTPTTETSTTETSTTGTSTTGTSTTGTSTTGSR
jgi:hypothetical protein